MYEPEVLKLGDNSVFISENHKILDYVASWSNIKNEWIHHHNSQKVFKFNESYFRSDLPKSHKNYETI